MKKLAILLGLLLVSSSAVFADEVTPAQSAKNNQTYFTANIQKQPQNSKQKQDINNHFTFFTINIQINGKIDNFTDTNKEYNRYKSDLEVLKNDTSSF